MQGADTRYAEGGFASGILPPVVALSPDRRGAWAARDGNMVLAFVAARPTDAGACGRCCRSRSARSSLPFDAAEACEGPTACSRQAVRPGTAPAIIPPSRSGLFAGGRRGGGRSPDRIAVAVGVPLQVFDLVAEPSNGPVEIGSSYLPRRPRRRTRRVRAQTAEPGFQWRAHRAPSRPGTVRHRPVHERMSIPALRQLRRRAIAPRDCPSRRHDV